MHDTKNQPTLFLRLPAVKERTALSGSTIWAKVKNGTFPKPIKITENCTAWTSEAIEAWAQDRISASRLGD